MGGTRVYRPKTVVRGYTIEYRSRHLNQTYANLGGVSYSVNPGSGLNQSSSGDLNLFQYPFPD